MKIVVCVKQVPATHEVSIDPVTKRLIREGVAAEVNPFDRYAIEQAVLMREQLGGEVVVLSMGPPQAADALREAIASGADSALLLSDPALAGSDTALVVATHDLAIAQRLPTQWRISHGRLEVA